MRRAIADAVRQARAQRGWTQSVLAEKAGVSRPTIARIEGGQDVRMATLQQVLSCLHIEIVSTSTVEDR